MGACGLLEAEEGARLLVDPPLAHQVVSRVLHIVLNDTPWEWSEWASSPEYPERSAASVAISNSREVSRVSWSGLWPTFFPVTFLKVIPSSTRKMEYLDLIPGGRA